MMTFSRKGSFLTVVASLAFGVTVLFSNSSAISRDFWDILPGHANDVGDGWFIGSEDVSGGFPIYRLHGRDWERMPGGAVRIGGTYETPWVINSDHEIYRWDGRRWDRMPGNGKDVGDGWVIGLKKADGGFSIHRWTGRDWDQVPGGAVRIGGTYDTPWVINDEDEIYRWNGRGWDRMPGNGKDVGDGWVIGLRKASGGFGIYRWDGGGWDQVPGGGIGISKTVEKGPVYVVNELGKIYIHKTH